MERQEPQGEENGDALAFAHHINRGPVPQNQQQLKEMIRQRQSANLMLNTSNPTSAASNLSSSIGRLATPTAQPFLPNQNPATAAGQPLDSPIVTTGLTRHPHQEDLFTASRIKGGMPAPLLSPSVASVASSAGGMSTPTMQDVSSKLNPSVYSHPNAQDPVLMGPPISRSSYKSDLPLHRDLAVLSGKRSNVDVTSSGAFFDPRAVSKKSDLLAQSDIIAQLTREMKLGSGGVFSGSSDAVSTSSGGSANQLNQLGSTPASIAASSSSMSKQIISQLQQDAAKLSKMGIGAAAAATTASEVVRTATTCTAAPVTASATVAKLPTTSAITTAQNISSSSSSTSGYKTASSLSGVSSVSGGGLSSSTEMLLQQANIDTSSLSDFKLKAAKLGMPSTAVAATATSSNMMSSLGTTCSNPSAIQSSINTKPISNPAASALLSAEKLQLLSRSQPDLFTGIEGEALHPLPPLSPTALKETEAALHHSPIYANSGSAQILQQTEALRTENVELKSNINDMLKKIGKVQTLEQEMAKIHQAYQALLKHSEKREGLEKSARAKLQSVILNLNEANKEVTERHEAVMNQFDVRGAEKPKHTRVGHDSSGRNNAQRRAH